VLSLLRLGSRLIVPLEGGTKFYSSISYLCTIKRKVRDLSLVVSHYIQFATTSGAKFGLSLSLSLSLYTIW